MAGSVASPVLGVLDGTVAREAVAGPISTDTNFPRLVVDPADPVVLRVEGAEAGRDHGVPLKLPVHLGEEEALLAGAPGSGDEVDVGVASTSSYMTALLGYAL
jgi:hypothetical protein